MRGLTIGVIVALLAATGASAQDGGDKMGALLLRLKEKGILTDEEYGELMARASTPATNPAPAASATTVTTAAAAPAQEAAAARLDDKRIVRMTESGVGLEMGGVTFKVSGSINGFYVHDSGDKDLPQNVVVGGLASVGHNSSSIRNGLLPGFIKFDITTNQGGWDVGAHFGLYPGINSVTHVGGANSAGSPSALGTSGIDARQTYLTFGKANFGEVKIGRDIGLFGSEAILNDITLLGVGTAAGNSAPSNTSLGRIGLGYIYTDFQPQITYSTPKFGGAQLSVGAFQPLVTAGTSEINSTPGFQAKATYDFKTGGGLDGRVWLSGIVQRHDTFAGLPAYTGGGFDVGTKLGYKGFGLLGYYYKGWGLGTTGLFILSTDALGRTRESQGFYVQGTYSFGKFTLGGSYGESQLDLAKGEVNPLLLKANRSYVGQLRYGLTSWVNLVGEYIHTDSVAHGGNDAQSDALAVGAIVFF